MQLVRWEVLHGNAPWTNHAERLAGLMTFYGHSRIGKRPKMVVAFRIERMNVFDMREPPSSSSASPDNLL